MPEATEENKVNEKRLPLSDHLEELRSRIIKSILIVIGLFFINVAMSQNNALKITNLNTNKEKIIIPTIF